MTDKYEQQARDEFNATYEEVGHPFRYDGDHTRSNNAHIRAMSRVLERLAASEQAREEQARRFSDAMEVLQEWITGCVEWGRGDRAHFVELQGGRRVTFADFIIPKPVDPLELALKEVGNNPTAASLREACAKHGIPIHDKGEVR